MCLWPSTYLYLWIKGLCEHYTCFRHNSQGKFLQYEYFSHSKNAACNSRLQMRKYKWIMYWLHSRYGREPFNSIIMPMCSRNFVRNLWWMGAPIHELVNCCLKTLNSVVLSTAVSLITKRGISCVGITFGGCEKSWILSYHRWESLLTARDFRQFEIDQIWHMVYIMIYLLD